MLLVVMMVRAFLFFFCKQQTAYEWRIMDWSSDVCSSDLWTASACCALVMLGAAARKKIDSTTSTSFACDLRKWLQIMEAYEQGGFAYHATMPTDALTVLRNVMAETEAYGFEKVRAEQQELGNKVRALLGEKGYRSVAAPGFEAPGEIGRAHV